MRLIYVNFFVAFSLLLFRNVYAVENCDIFQYVYEYGEKIGQITIPNDYSYRAMIKVAMFAKTIYSKNSNIKIVFKSKKELLNGETPLVYNVYFPSQSSIPELLKIEFNGQVLCNRPDKVQHGGDLTHLWAQNYFSSQRTGDIPQRVTPRPVVTIKSPTFPAFTIIRPTSAAPRPGLETFTATKPPKVNSIEHSTWPLFSLFSTSTTHNVQSNNHRDSASTTTVKNTFINNNGIRNKPHITAHDSTSSVHQVYTKNTTQVNCKSQEFNFTGPDHSTKHSAEYKCNTLQTQNTAVYHEVSHKRENGK